MFGGTPPVVKNLILINVVMLLATYVLDLQFNGYATTHFALFYFESPYFKPMQYVTHMFMHGGITHLFFNMFALWMFGRVLESVWGSKRFFIYYIITGLGAAALHTFVNYLHYSHIQSIVTAFSNNPTPDLFESILRNDFFKTVSPDFIQSWTNNPGDTSYAHAAVNKLREEYTYLINIPTVGASGAIFGVLLAFGMLFPNTELMLLFPPIPIKAKWFVTGYGAIELYLGLTQPGSNIAHFAHLGGMLFGFFLIKYWNSKRTNFY